MGLFVKKQRKFLILAILCSLSVFISDEGYASVVWERDMSSLADWTEESNAVPEEGDDVGGIRVQGDVTQMNSWWDSAGWTRMTASSGFVIQDDMIYTLENNSYRGVLYPRMILLDLKLSD